MRAAALPVRTGAASSRPAATQMPAFHRDAGTVLRASRARNSCAKIVCAMAPSRGSAARRLLAIIISRLCGDAREFNARAVPHQARQHLVAEVRQLVEIIDEREPDPAHAGLGDGVEFLRLLVRSSTEGVAADRVGGEIPAFLLVFLRRNRLRRDALVRQHAVDRAPIGVLDDGVAVIVLRLALAVAADHLPDREYLDVAAITLRLALDL